MRKVDTICFLFQVIFIPFLSFDYLFVSAQKRGIFCISPRSVNISGLINCVCFDKTGTLTEDGLDLWGAVPVEQVKKVGVEGDDDDDEGARTSGSFRQPLRPGDLAACGNTEVLIEAMATCHSLTLIDGQLTGDPLDVIVRNLFSGSYEKPSVTCPSLP
jgi:cation-transporting ATPase 13A3/4/5